MGKIQLTGEIFHTSHTLLPYFNPKTIYDIYLNDKVTNKPAVCKQNLAPQKSSTWNKEQTLFCVLTRRIPLVFPVKKQQAQLRLSHYKCSITDAKLIKSGKEQ